MCNLFEFCVFIIVILLINPLHEHKTGYQYKNNL